MRATLFALGLGLGLCLCVTSCNRAPPEPTGTPNVTQDPPGTPAPGAQGSQGSSGARPGESTDLHAAPRVEVPSGSPPTELRQRDIVVGAGAEAHTGQTVDVQYTGVAWSTRRQFDSSWTRGGRPFSFPLGQRRVIPGWDQGVAGMRVGGRRELIIPPALGYAERGAGADIGPNETLVFVVDLVAVH